MDSTPFGHYQLQELIGRGGMGEVYRACDTVTDRIVALKVLLPHLAQDAAFQERFRRESHAAAGVSNPHVVPIHGYGEIDGRLYLDMRLIAGRNLGAVLTKTGKPLDPTFVIGRWSSRWPRRSTGRMRPGCYPPRRQAVEHPDRRQRLRVPDRFRAWPAPRATRA